METTYSLTSGDRKARGRNGYFVPKRIEVWESPKDTINFTVSSAREGDREPIILRVNKEDAQAIAHLLLNAIKAPVPAPQAVIFIGEAGVDSVVSNVPGLDVVSVNYDVEYADKEDIQQFRIDRPTGETEVNDALLYDENGAHFLPWLVDQAFRQVIRWKEKMNQEVSETA